VTSDIRNMPVSSHQLVCQAKRLVFFSQQMKEQQVLAAEAIAVVHFSVSILIFFSVFSLASLI